MTAYELRRHLAKAHLLELRGLDYDNLLQFHDEDHEVDQNHTHEDHTDAV